MQSADRRRVILGMSNTFRVGDRVRVAFPSKHLCARHDRVNFPTEGVKGVVIRVRDDAEHARRGA
jgi:hypothetical protein